MEKRISSRRHGSIDRRHKDAAEVSALTSSQFLVVLDGQGSEKGLKFGKKRILEFGLEPSGVRQIKGLDKGNRNKTVAFIVTAKLRA